MAKSVTRVHILATELGVKSNAIVEKCQAEGLDIKNHMSTISAGLAATIREWFSEGEHDTAVETSKRVDLKKVRVRKKKSQKAEISEEAPQEKPLETVEAEKTAVPVKEEHAAPAAVVEKVPAAEPAEAEKKPATSKEIPETKKSAAKAKPAAKPKPEPKPVVPAGPMLDKPKPAKLSGPQVVRVEKIEPEEARPKRTRPAGISRPSRPRYNEPISEPLIPSNLAIGETKRPKGPKGRGRGGRRTPDEDVDVRIPANLRKMRTKDIEERQARLAAASGETLRSRPIRHIEAKHHMREAVPVERPEKATVSEPITVKNLSAALAAKTGEIIAKLITQGITATANQVIASDVAELIALELGTELTVERKNLIFDNIRQEFGTREKANLKKRSPVVTMLGHVDHGKTSLLDRIRSASVAKGEAGGITQHIGAYQADFNGRKVTFLDTPGHEAFTAMRARGANMTDIVVLVVAADDGVMPQTIEAINHAKAAGVEIIVALNKIDLPGVDVNRIYGQLAAHGLTPALWDGNTEIVKTSAATGEGIEDLIEHLDYVAELKDYKADNTIPATGWVVEAKMTTTQGPVATLLIKEGKLGKGDIVLAGASFGRVRTLKDSKGKSIKSAESSMPVEVTGLNQVPGAGDLFFCLDDLNRAKQAADELAILSRQKTLAKRSTVTLENLFNQIEAGNIKELNIIIRADVQGSVDVLQKYLDEISTDEVKIRILQAVVGGITEGDVVLAEASNAIIIGFNVVPDDRVRSIAEAKGVDIRLYNIIYRITEDLRAAMVGLLEPEMQEKHLGQVTVRKIFKVSSLGTVAGCIVSSGTIAKNAKVRLIRNNIVIKDACSIESLKHFKDDAREVKAGLECGVKIAGFDDVKVDDVLDVFEIIEVARKL